MEAVQNTQTDTNLNGKTHYEGRCATIHFIPSQKRLIERLYNSTAKKKKEARNAAFRVQRITLNTVTVLH